MNQKTIISIALLTSIAGGVYFYHSSSSVVDTPLSGGEGTVFGVSRDSFATPMSNLPTEKLRDFTFGNKMFNTNWVTAPASVKTLDGLGPTFNRVSCSGCHFKDGRGRPPASPDEPMNSMLLRLSIPGVAEDGGPMPHPAYGGQLNDKAILGVPAEGRAVILYEELEGSFADGKTYQLRKPTYHFEQLNFGPMGEDILFSPRVAPAVFGLGLLEAVPEEDILARADPEDKNKDGISGRANFVWDPIQKKKALGRFGWKANVSSLALQDSGAANGDMGITTSLFPKQNCPDVQKECKRAFEGGQPEMSDEQLRRLTFYVQTLGVPARRDLDNPDVKKGAVLFEKARCTSCHTPTLKTGDHEVPQNAHQTIHPFTDLLLHDMGEGLADNRPDYEANGREWRTAPLWGIGLVNVVNGHTNFLHDGRARNLEEAVLWHGGEAESAKQEFVHMNEEERKALIRFLESL